MWNLAKLSWGFEIPMFKEITLVLGKNTHLRNLSRCYGFCETFFVSSEYLIKFKKWLFFVF